MFGEHYRYVSPLFLDKKLKIKNEFNEQCFVDSEFHSFHILLKMFRSFPLRWKKTIENR